MLQAFKSEIKLFLIVAAVSAVLAVAGIFLLQAGLGPSSPTPVPQTPSPPTPAPQPPVSDTEGWQTYRNTESGFEFRYPKDDQCDLIETGENSWSLGSIDMDVLNAQGLSLEKYVDDFVEKRSKEPYNWIFAPRQQTEVDDREAIALSYRFGGLNRLAEVTFIMQGENIYALSWSAGGFVCNEPEIFPQILATFRFVDEKNRQTTITPKNKEECVLQGGRWEVFGNVPGVSKEQCALPTSDAGTLCTNSSQCESICVSYDTTLSLGQEAAGVCYAWDFPAAAVWCSWFIEDGKATLLPCP